MIRALIFDMDGTLVQTERLKALAYARAARMLDPRLSEEQVIEVFKEVVGLSRRRVSQTILERFGLEEAARSRLDEFGAAHPWQVLTRMRLALYEEMLSDPEMIRASAWPHTIALLDAARRWGCKVGLATMSSCSRAAHILDILGVRHRFDFIAALEDVEHPKPAPEIYLLVAEELDVLPHECLVLEDSPGGVQAALAAGMEVIAIATPLTREALHRSNLLPPERIVDDPARLQEVAEARVRQGE
ncbi:MAG: HAD family phosphatase [Anaerolineae bacterium]|nr:MAG: HAD family phosphatase [Anaerolineae bacterium]